MRACTPFAAFAVSMVWVLIAFHPSALAQQPFPSKSIRIIVPFSAGGGDLIARKIATRCCALNV